MPCCKLQQMRSGVHCEAAYLQLNGDT